jgi:hypothetical protein
VKIPFMLSITEKSGDVTAAAKHAKNQHVVALDAINDDVFALRESSAGRSGDPRRVRGRYWDDWREEKTDL